MKFVTMGLAAALVTAAVALSSAATALTITNRATTTQEVTVAEGDSIMQVILQPNETREDLCANGCVMSHVSGDEFPLSGDEEVEVDESGLTIPE